MQRPESPGPKQEAVPVSCKGWSASPTRVRVTDDSSFASTIFILSTGPPSSPTLGGSSLSCSHDLRTPIKV